MIDTKTFITYFENNQSAIILYKYESLTNPDNIAIMYYNTIANTVHLVNGKTRIISSIEPLRLANMARAITRDILGKYDNLAAANLEKELELIANKAIN